MGKNIIKNNNPDNNNLGNNIFLRPEEAKLKIFKKFDFNH